MEEEMTITKELCLKKLYWVGILHVATVDEDNRPQVRCVSAIHYEPDAIYFYTARGKSFARQLESSGYVQMEGLTKYKEMIRLSGKVVKAEEISQQKQVKAVSEKKETNSNGRYAIIICSLKKQSQVAQYFQENKDINPANVIKKNGYYMIYFNRGDNYQELVKEAKQMPKPYTEFWITQV